MSLKHYKHTRAQILARRAAILQGVKTIFVPKRVICIRGKVVHANPHVMGEKERERGARCYMQHYFPIDGPIQTSPLSLRSAPIMQITSKRHYYEMAF